MKVLLDTHLVIGLLANEPEARFSGPVRALMRSDHGVSVSVATLWELAIKTRLGKLEIGCSLAAIPFLLDLAEIDVLAVEVRHVLASLDPLPPTRDPFDRLLLAQCQVEGLRLATVDRALASHPLAICL